MLVLSRKLGERIVIADSIVLTVLQVGDGRIRLGVEAPPQIRILREELQTRMNGKTLGAGDRGTR